MTIRMMSVWLSVVSGLLFFVTSQANANQITITGRLPEAADQPVGSVDSGPVGALSTQAEVTEGPVYPQLTFHLGGRGGTVIQAPNGVLPLICLKKSGTPTIDDVCQGGVKVNLPPAGVYWMFPGYGEMPHRRRPVTLVVTPSGRGSAISFTDSGVDFVHAPDTGNTYSIKYRSREVFSTYWGNTAASAPARGIMNAYAGEGLTPGTYTGQISVTGGQYAGSDTTTYTINVLPPFPKCTITPPSPVSFGAHTLSQNALIATAQTTIRGGCTSSDPADDGKGIYMTFYPGNYGWYENNLQKLATSLDGIYITGDSETAGCGGGDLYFDRQPHPAYQVGSIRQGASKPFSKTLNFSLCRDTGFDKKVALGAMEANAIVDVVVQ
ncbi:MAG: hypothetical protein ACTH4K_08685 [Serratia bockelmannii]